MGMLAAAVGMTADVLLLYVPNGGYENWDYRFFTQIGADRLLWGHFLGVIFIPFELLGFWQVYKALEPAGRRFVLPVMLPIVLVTVWGVAYHAMLAGLAAVMRLQGAGALLPAVFEDTYLHLKTAIEPLGYLLFGIFVYISGGLFYLIRYRVTLYPRWVAWVNPLLVYLLAVGLYMLFPQHVGSAAVVAGFNLAIFVTLAVSTAVLWRR